MQLRAPQASTHDAKLLRGKKLGGEIFSAFSDQERVGIWERLQHVQGLIPSLDDFFENINYLMVLANCLKWLTPLSRGETMSMAMQRLFSNTRETASQATVQISDAALMSTSTNLADRVNFGYRSLIAFAMGNHRRIPKKPSGKDLLAKPTLEPDKAALREFADLAWSLGFTSPEIIDMQRHPISTATAAGPPNSRPLLVTDGCGVSKEQRSGTPRNRAYKDDGPFLLLNHLHGDTEETGEGITSFFVRKHIYLAFFGKWRPNSTIATMQERFVQERQAMFEQDGQSRREQETQARLEQQRLEQQRLQREEQARLEQERLQLEEQARLQREEQARLEQGRLQLEKQARLQREEQARLEQERVQLEEQAQPKALACPFHS
jgi:hypothetical protein